MKKRGVKRGQAELISTILLILLTIAIAAIIIGFVVPFVKDQLAKGDCFDFNGKIEIKSTEYTCYDSANKTLRLQIGIADIDQKKKDFITGLKIIVNKEGSSESFEIINGSATSRILMYNRISPTETILTVPNNGEERTYNISDISEKPVLASAYPILKTGKNCPESNSELNNIDDCTRYEN